MLNTSTGAVGVHGDYGTKILRLANVVYYAMRASFSGPTARTAWPRPTPYPLEADSNRHGALGIPGCRDRLPTVAKRVLIQWRFRHLLPFQVRIRQAEPSYTFDYRALTAPQFRPVVRLNYSLYSQYADPADLEA